MSANSTPFHVRLEHWISGAVSSSLQGGGIATKAFLGTAAAHGMGLPVPAMDWQQVACVFVGGMLYHFVDYLTNTPLPETDEPGPGAQPAAQAPEAPTK